MSNLDYKTIKVTLETYDRIVENKHGMDTISDVINRCLEKQMPKDQRTLADV